MRIGCEVNPGLGILTYELDESKERHATHESLVNTLFPEIVECSSNISNDVSFLLRRAGLQTSQGKHHAQSVYERIVMFVRSMLVDLRNLEVLPLKSLSFPAFVCLAPPQVVSERLSP
jgi:hypothetical protein